MEKQSEVKDHNDHLEKVKKQIEYYFSAENLINDTFLASQMDSEKSVPISTVMNFSKLKALTEDEEIIRRSLDTSIIVSVFDNRIRLNSDITSKQVGQRSTIILREITSDVSEDEIKEIFNYEGCKAIQSLRSDIENTWFVVMESEEDAKETILQLQLHKRCIRGERVKARVKPESKIRAFFPTPPQPLIPIVPMPFLPYPAFEDPRMFPFNLQGMQMSMEQTDEIAAHDGQVKQNEKRTHGENHGKKHHSPSDKDSHTKKSHTKKDGSGSGSKGRGDSDGSPSAKGSLSNIQNVSSETENNTNPNVDTAIVISPSTPVDANNKHSGSWAAILKATPTPTDSPQKINKASSEPSPEKHQMKDSHPNTSELNVKTSNITDTLNSTFQSATFVEKKVDVINPESTSILINPINEEEKIEQKEIKETKHVLGWGGKPTFANILKQNEAVRHEGSDISVSKNTVSSTLNNVANRDGNKKAYNDKSNKKGKNDKSNNSGVNADSESWRKQANIREGEV